MSLADIEALGYDIESRNHARAILQQDFPTQLDSLCETLVEFTIAPGELIRGGGGEATLTQRLRRALEHRGWPKRTITVRKFVDGDERPFTTHEIDHFRTSENGSIGLEIEWNNKDPFYDRDLENFQRLNGEGALSVGVIVTRGSGLQQAFTAIVRNEADAQGIMSFDDLEQAFDLQPDSKAKRSSRSPGCGEAGAIRRRVGTPLCAKQIRHGDDPLGQTSRAGGARRWKPVPATLIWLASVGCPVAIKKLEIWKTQRHRRVAQSQ